VKLPSPVICAGIDYSITSPCVAVGPIEPFSFDACQFLVLNSHPPKDLSKFPNIQLLDQLDTSSKSIDRYIYNADHIVKFIRHHNARVAFLEDYAMGASGRVFNIGENGGVLKYILHQNKIGLNCIPPTVIKKFATGKGNAKKEQMWEQFALDTGREDLYEAMIGKTKIKSPLTDIVDAYYILKYAGRGSS
jgi:hypothetical protein